MAGNPGRHERRRGRAMAAGYGKVSVVHLGSTYHMWYGGTDNHPNYRIGYSPPPDGLAWTKNAANPVLGLGAANACETGLRAEQVVHYGGTFHMWYGGTTTPGSSATPPLVRPGTVNWVKEPDNPVLTWCNPSWECGDSVDFSIWLSGTGPRG